MATKTTIGPKEPGYISHLAAGESLTGKEGYAVELGSTGWTVSNAQGEVAFPVAVGAASGEAVAVAGPGCIVPVIVDEAVAVWAKLTSNGSGKFEAASTNDLVTAIALEASGADGDFVMALVVGPYISA